ncbi:uncharacterized protein BT62DRAFT_957389 [Guyanagaster necrorhizus]|uniref:Uncharacterized protein n=1 Tax=Guyanagaster necrorhizus TaxID=856835 RepID=A0A9P8ALR5_9AGAR|nr:uncharacterized protein BT62DRAFT_957389 [Guyanagaster necrorhizus MCA 3950]KAG7440075.1 hypothetical protein BT62DRAFT_957389 [Guyanagaster necrorhizus MCA 3950]
MEVVQSLPDELEQKLEALVSVAEILGLDDMSFANYSRALVQLSEEQLSLKQMQIRLAFIERQLVAHLATAKHEHYQIKKWTEHFQSDIQSGESVEDTIRRREALLRKAKEYRKELSALPISEPPVTISDLIAQSDRIKQRKEQIKAKRSKIKAFKGVPPNLDLARTQLREAREEQVKLFQLRERLMEKMTSGVS